jgi:hypothetical protein
MWMETQMNSNSKAKVVLAIGFMVAMCALALYAITPQQTTGMVPMLKPIGQFWSGGVDAHNAKEINQPNSEANRNNGEAAKSFAEATQITQDTQAARETAAMGGVLAVFIVLAICIGLFAIFHFAFGVRA